MKIDFQDNKKIGIALDTDPKRIKANFNLGYADCLRKIEDRVTVV